MLDAFANFMEDIKGMQHRAAVNDLQHDTRALSDEIARCRSTLTGLTDVKDVRDVRHKIATHIRKLDDEVHDQCRSHAEKSWRDRRRRSRLQHGRVKLQASWSRLQQQLDDREHSVREARRLRRLRALRVEIQDLQQLIARAGADSASFETYASCIKSGAADMRKLIDAIKDEDPEMVDDDELRRLEDFEQQLMKLLPTPADESSDKRAVRLQAIDTICHDMINIIGWRTIPDRLNAWLNNAWAGTSLSFHKVFEDELAGPADRQRLLNFLSYAPKKLNNAIVDTDTGLVYKYHEKSWIRGIWVSVLGLAFIAASVVVAIAGGELLHAEGWRSSVMYILWSGVVAGVAFHAAADAMKRARTLGTASASGLGVGQITRWIDARLTALFLRLLLMMVGAIGAFAMLRDQLSQVKTAELPGSAVFTMFLVGYGLDSFVDIFVESTQQRSAALVASWKKQLSPSESAPS